MTTLEELYDAAWKAFDDFAESLSELNDCDMEMLEAIDAYHSWNQGCKTFTDNLGRTWILP